MKNLFRYHLITLPPMILLLALYVYQNIGVGTFAATFLFYAFVFRPILDFQRLKEKGLMEEKDFWKVFGTIRFKYYYQLMFER